MFLTLFVLSCKINSISALNGKFFWEEIKDKFNASAIVTPKLTKLWYNMKAKAREAKTKENVCNMTGGVPSIADIYPVDVKVMDIDKNILPKIEVDIDSDINENMAFVGDSNDQAWDKYVKRKGQGDKRENQKSKSPIKKTKKKLNKIDSLKIEILKEELSYKQRLHKEEIKQKVMETEYKQQILEIELQIAKKLQNIHKENLE